MQMYRLMHISWNYDSRGRKYKYTILISESPDYFITFTLVFHLKATSIKSSLSNWKRNHTVIRIPDTCFVPNPGKLALSPQPEIVLHIWSTIYHY